LKACSSFIFKVDITGWWLYQNLTCL